MRAVVMQAGLRWAQALLFLLAIAAPGAVLAQDAPGAAPGDEKEDPDEVTQGSAYVSLPTQFAIPFKDGERYEEHEFEKDGKVLVLPALDRTETHVFELRPMDTEKYGPATVEIAPKCWKLKKVSKELKVWRCELTAKFPKGTPGAPTPPPKEPEPEEDPDIPPMPGVPPPPPDFPQGD